MTRFLAIDPGANGGLAWNDITGTRFGCLRMPETESATILALRCRAKSSPVVIMEQVWGHIGKMQTGASMFSFGENYGFLKGVIQTLDLPLLLVTPRVWQKALELGKKKDYDYPSTITKGERKGEPITRNAWKEHLVQTADKYYPQLYPTTETADAILIMHYGINFI